jgi:hypothetical protein
VFHEVSRVVRAIEGVNWRPRSTGVENLCMNGEFPVDGALAKNIVTASREKKRRAPRADSAFVSSFA